jgi:iron complex transport system ATP-binding protein
MIARALAQRTPVMILDEPTSFLDVASRLEIMELLRMLARDFNTAVLLSTHDVASALTVASRLWLMPGNRRLIAGTTDTLLADGSLPSLFAGRNVRFDAVAMDFRLGQ